MVSPTPFTLSIPDPEIADRKARLARSRFPDEPPLEPWSTGTSLAYLTSLIDYWQNGFDWRAWEAKLTGFPQFALPIRGIDVHFIRARARKPDAMPLLLSHGWPGSVFEFHKIIPLLTEHFTVVAPSLPGYTLSFKPGQQRFGIVEVAEIFAELMSALGYQRFGAQGGDWGSFITSVLGHRVPERVTGIHLSLLPVRRDPATLPNPDAEEKIYLDQLRNFLKEETGYQWIQGTRPQTLAGGLPESPAGLAAWIVEKFHAWTDNKGNPEDAVSRDEMLANISLYWFTAAIGSSFWPYYVRMHGPWPIPDGEVVVGATGDGAFPREILNPPRSLAAKTYTDIRRWSPMKKGGHFAALEQPEALAHEVIAFFD